jgi:hypothetical protein
MSSLVVLCLSSYLNVLSKYVVEVVLFVLKYGFGIQGPNEKGYGVYDAKRSMDTKSTLFRPNGFTPTNDDVHDTKRSMDTKSTFRPNGFTPTKQLYIQISRLLYPRALPVNLTKYLSLTLVHFDHTNFSDNIG